MMAFKGNPFALLNDEDDGDGSQLLPPPSAPESKKPAGHNNVKSKSGGGKQSGRGGRRRGSARNNNAQEKGMQNNNYRHSNDNRRYDGHSDGYRQHRRGAYGDLQQNMGGNGYWKNDVHEQNNADSGDGKGNGGGNWGNWNRDYKFVRRGNGEVKTYEGKEAVGGNEELKNGNLIAEVPREREPRQNGQEVSSGNNSGEGFREQKLHDNTMTLQEYDEQFLEKRKALEAFKQGERKVTLDKELESMQLVGKKKDDVAFAEQSSEKEKLKKDDGLGMDEKVRRVSGHHEIKEARMRLVYRRYTRPLAATKDEAPKTGEPHKIPDEAPRTGDSPKIPNEAPESVNSHRIPSEAPAKTPDVEDGKQFPVLSRSQSKNSKH